MFRSQTFVVEQMSVVEARDYVLWPKHIHGNPLLRNELLALEAGGLVP
jgi:hypothetical protein